jgi:nucleotide-binding universal stress UspA family protein
MGACRIPAAASGRSGETAWIATPQWMAGLARPVLDPSAHALETGTICSSRHIMIALKNVLVATDFSEPSATALDYGRAIARTFAASLHVVHVLDNVMLRGALADAAPANYADLLEELESAGRRQLEATVREDDRRELDARTKLLAFVAPARGIVEYAKDANIDLIVMGTHGRGAWSQLVMGSVAEKVVRTAPCPVLTVRHPEHEFLKPDALQVVEQVKN